MPNWKEVLKAVAPSLASCIGGPFAGVAMQTIGIALGLDGNEEAAIGGKILAANPQDLLKIREAESQFIIDMKKINIDLEKVMAQDRNDARNREIQIRDKVPALLAFCVTVGFFGVLAFMLSHGVPSTGGEALLVMLGTLGAAWGSVVQYFYGSSSGSDRKTEIMSLKR